MYLPLIKEDLDEHMRSMRRRRKRRSTKNPKFPAGTHRPCELMLRSSHGIAVNEDCMRVLDQAAFDYWERRNRTEAMAPWDEDPLKTEEARALRGQVFSSMSFGSLKERYRALRQLTRDIMAMAVNQP